MAHSKHRDNALVIFSKTPGHSPAKTRLAKETDSQLAADVHHALFHYTLNAVRSLHSVCTLYACPAEDLDSYDNYWSGFNRIECHENELKYRVPEIMNRLVKIHDSVLIIGTDCPSLVTNTIHQAIDFLQKDKVVIGPSCDGGFYLLASSTPVSKDKWNAVRWSCKHTCLDVIQTFSPTPLTKMDTKQDIDSLHDLNTFLSDTGSPRNELRATLREKFSCFQSRSGCSL